jgi:hypothetical protein
VSEYAQGGYIPSDAPIPERLLGDCGYVITAEQAKRYGRRLLRRLNEPARHELGVTDD